MNKPPRAPVARTPPPDPWEFERAAFENGARIVVGIDEAGRGPLAGPVVAAAVVLPRGFDLTGINDSKKLSPAARERAYERLRAELPPAHIGVGLADAAEIDLLNILRATHEAMRRALAALGVGAVDVVLVDGLPVRDLHPNSLALVKGDSRSASIAAASIVAKVTRDRLMAGHYHTLHPAYDFARHKGYPTADHIAALARHGPCAIHRRSFAPVAGCARGSMSAVPKFRPA